MSSSETRISELRTIRRSSSVKEIMSKFSGSSVPETIDAFNSRIRKMSQSERAMHRAMTKIADKISNSPMTKNSSPIFRSGQAPILPAEWSRRDMCSILRHWSVAVQKERPGIVFTPSDAKQALAAQDINEGSVTASQWSEWETAIDEIVRNQDSSQLYTSESELSIDDQSQGDDAASLPSMPSSPVRESNAVSPVAMTHLSLGIASEMDSVEVTPSMLSIAEKRKLFDNQSRRQSTIKDNATDLNLVSAASSSQSAFVQPETLAEVLLEVQNSEKIQQLSSPEECTISEESQVPLSVENGSSLQINESLVVSVVSEINASNSVNSSFVSSCGSKTKKKQRKAATSQTNVANSKRTPITNPEKTESTAQESSDQEKLSANSTFSGSTTTQTTAAVPKNSKLIESKQSKESSSLADLASSSRNNATENSSKPPSITPKERKLSEKEKEVLRKLGGNSNHLQQEAISSQRLSSASKANVVSNAILLLVMILVPLVTIVGVSVVLWPDVSQSNMHIPKPFGQKTIDTMETTDSWNNASSTSFIANKITTAEVEQNEGAQFKVLDSAQGLADTSNSNPVAHDGHSTIPIRSTTKLSTTAVSSAVPHWRRPFQNLLHGIKQKLNQIVQHLFPWSRRKPKIN